MQSTVPSLIQDLNVELKLYENVNLTLNGTCLYMKLTVLFLFEPEHMFYELSQYTHDVSKKFEYFMSFLRQNCIINKSEVANTLCVFYTKFMIKVL